MIISQKTDRTKLKRQNRKKVVKSNSSNRSFYRIYMFSDLRDSILDEEHRQFRF